MGIRDDGYVWAGRRAVSGGDDSWRTSPSTAHDRISDAARVWIADVLSFPWEECGSLLQARPYTVFVAGDSERTVLWDQLAKSKAPPSTVDLILDDWDEFLTAHLPDSMEAQALAKRKFVSLACELISEIRPIAQSIGRADVRVTLLGFDRRERAALGQQFSMEFATGSTRVELVDHELASGALVPVDAVMVAIHSDETDLEVRSQVAGAFRNLEPGGSLVVIADVVARHALESRRSVSQVVELIDRATGLRHSIADLRSVRWPGDDYTCGLIIRTYSIGASSDTGVQT